MAEPTREYVLVHGAAHGAWCWEDVAKRLEAKGGRVVALDLPGHGRRAAEAGRASVAAYARAVADRMALEGVSRAILVGHSMGGVVIAKAAELVPDRIAHLVFVAAVALPHGASVMEAHIGPSGRAAFLGLAAGSGGRTLVFPASMAKARWLGDLPASHPAIGRALAAITPQPLRPFLEPVDLRVFYTLSIPRTYIRCRRDAAVPPAKAAEYAARLGVTPIDLDSDHDPMLSAPEELARLLDRV